MNMKTRIDTNTAPNSTTDDRSRKGGLYRISLVLGLSLGLIALPLSLVAETATESETGGDASAEMARKLQNPLANMKAVMTDNAIGFNTGDDNGTSFGFQLQPVYAIDLPDQGFTLIPRAVIPILGLEPGTDIPKLGAPVSGNSSVWGLGDIVLQGFVAPHSDSKWKWGVGPQVSLGTATDARLRGSDWGAGLVGVVTGNITEDLSFAGILGNVWSFNGDFSVMTFQPMTFYNINAIPGAYLGYTATVAVDWKAASRDQWTVPVGVSIGRTFDIGGGHGLDLNLGPYYNAVRPRGAADWSLRFGITWVMP